MTSPNNETIPQIAARQETPWYRVHLPRFQRKGKSFTKIQSLRKERFEALQKAKETT